MKKFFLDENDNIENNNNTPLMEAIMNSIDETTMIQITSSSKKKAMINRAILDIAKEEQDPLYFKYASGKKRMKYFREKLRQKYYSKARARVESQMTRR